MMFKNPADKTERRSPIRKPPLRAPGQSLHEEMIDLFFDRWLAYLMFPVVGWTLVATEWIRWATHDVPTLRSALISTAIGVPITLFCLWRGMKTWKRLKNIRQGMEGEVAVGQFLDEQCRDRGYKLLHDLKGDGFNVDHILIGPGGIFSIETKTISKPTIGEPVVSYDGEAVLVDRFAPDRDPVAQARACARHVCELLAESTNRPTDRIFVRPVVLYPGWYIEGSSSGREVWVLNPKALPKFLEHEQRRLSNEDVGLYYSHLKTRNRG